MIRILLLGDFHPSGSFLLNPSIWLWKDLCLITPQVAQLWFNLAPLPVEAFGWLVAAGKVSTVDHQR